MKNHSRFVFASSLFLAPDTGTNVPNSTIQADNEIYQLENDAFEIAAQASRAEAIRAQQSKADSAPLTLQECDALCATLSAQANKSLGSDVFTPGMVRAFLQMVSNGKHVKSGPSNVSKILRGYGIRAGQFR